MLDFHIVVLSCIIGAFGLLAMYIYNVFKAQADAQEEMPDEQADSEKQKVSNTSMMTSATYLSCLIQY